MTKWTPTQWRAPRTGDTPLRVRFRNGEVAKYSYTAKQLNWSDRGFDWDIVSWRED